MQKIIHDYIDNGLYIREEEYYLSKKQADKREAQLRMEDAYEAIWNLQLCFTWKILCKCLAKKKTYKIMHKVKKNDI